MNQVKRKRIVKGSVLVAAAAVVGFWAGHVRAGGIPTGVGTLTYSGTLESAGGEPLVGEKQIKIALHDADTAGTQLCETINTVTLDGGRFRIPLLGDCTDAVKANPDLWAEVTVDGASLGRTKLAAVPYAVEADRAARLSTTPRVEGGIGTGANCTGGTNCLDNASCLTSEVLVGGGCNTNANDDATFFANHPEVGASPPRTWVCRARRPVGTGAYQLYAYAVCLPAP